MDSASAKSYLAKHGLEEAVSNAVLQVIRDRPADPIREIGRTLLSQSTSATDTSTAGTLSTLTWNLAAVNNNPFEYWLTHPDPGYAALMEAVEHFMEEPGDYDIPVGEVLTKPMFDELDALMTAQGWPCAEEAATAYAELAGKRIISGFMKDKALGSKRLMSMPDRMTNTIDVVGGGRAFRPTVISSFDGEMGTVDAWWALWKDFLFASPLELPGKKGGPPTTKLPCALLTKIQRDKYPALTEEEEAMSVRLQTICLAAFDAVLVHMLQVLSPDGKWVGLKRDILDALLHKKEANVGAILTGPYAATDVLFLQEVRTSNTLQASLGAAYEVLMPATPSKADQNSAVALKKSAFDVAGAADVTAEARAKFPSGGAAISDGDLIVITVSDASGRPFLLASFHGDTDGLATAPTLAAVHALHTEAYPSHALVFGLDANVYEAPKPGKQAGATDFLADVAAKGYAASSGERLEVTTFNMRTFLQPQLQKACRAKEKKKNGDVNPKDYILYEPKAFGIKEFGVDNTTRKERVDQVIPTMEWPSDHCLVFTTFSKN